jgi:glutamine amidotransferase|tara:strand:- start:26326 stop:26943 length:618 start_codon:yes stop_codon:yes gene_type:complete
MIAIVDYGMGNTFSVLNAFDYLGEDVSICSSAEELSKAERIVLPGVGAFPDCMEALKKRDLVDILNKKVLIEKVPFLGICLGMQVLSSYGEESGGEKGLGWLSAEVRKMKPNLDLTKIPNIGWEPVVSSRQSALFSKSYLEQDFYFVHSYHMICDDELDVTSYYLMEDRKIVSSVQKENIFGVQFHPEKSSTNGMDILMNFLRYT